MQSLWCLYWNIPGYICQYYGCGHPFALDICSRCYVCMLVFRIFAACKVVVITVHLMQPRCRSNTIHDLNLARGVSFVQVIKHEPCLEAGPADSQNSDICSMIHVGLASNTGVNVHNMERNRHRITNETWIIGIVSKDITHLRIYKSKIRNTISWCCDWNIAKSICQYHGCWCPSLLDIISSRCCVCSLVILVIPYLN